METYARGPNLLSDPLNQGKMLLPEIQEAVFNLEGWLETMRQPGGYGGPAVHWWGDCLDYTGPGLDWRYEGIIIGYLNLWAGTNDPGWLEKACRAGDDLVAGQLPNGNYRNSGFEKNPSSAGTPHEAACDLALLRLAEAVQTAGLPGWQKYLHTAERNLCDFYLDQLWDQHTHCFWEHPDLPVFIPDRCATLLEALFSYASITSSYGWVETYIMPAIERILEHQVPSGELMGAIYYQSIGKRKNAWFFPYHIARCIPALMAVWEWTGDARCASAARRAAQFILNWREANGGFCQVIYPGKRVNRFPQWIAGVGDILRALDLVKRMGLEYDVTQSLNWLLEGQRPDGGILTAAGFGRVTPGRMSADPRDDLCVCGWADKAFRYLSSQIVEYN